MGITVSVVVGVGRVFFFGVLVLVCDSVLTGKTRIFQRSCYVNIINSNMRNSALSKQADFIHDTINYRHQYLWIGTYIQSVVDISKLIFHLELLISQSNFSDPRKFTLRYR